MKQSKDTFARLNIEDGNNVLYSYVKQMVVEELQAVFEEGSDKSRNQLKLGGFIDIADRAQAFAEIPVKSSLLVTDHDNDNFRMVETNISEQLDAVSVRQVDIQQQDIGARCC